MPFSDLEKQREYMLAWGKTHREQRRKYMRNYYREHAEYFKKKNREYYRKKFRENPEYFREKSREKNRRYYEKLKERRRKVHKTLGGKCYVCGRTGRLELHHKKGFVSPYGQMSQGSATLRTLKEAENHPERFSLLCYNCHLWVSTFSKNPEMRERLLSLL